MVSSVSLPILLPPLSSSLTQSIENVSVVELYTALLSCPLLCSLRIKYDGQPTYKRARRDNYDDPHPLISPFFLEELSAILYHGRDTSTPPPFPRLETLSFDLVTTVESLALCEGAWSSLLFAIIGTSASTGGGTPTSVPGSRSQCRYPNFR
ncbi:hypothetical protein C8Q80DRAFT_1276628 [Daedaleopsis nitida]|nr:hypothetical protein C8Q80DRAFT_1276628 [Daedaleopsis nitida]